MQDNGICIQSDEVALEEHWACAPRADPAGVNFVGYLRTESGVGSAARGYVRGLRSAQLAVNMVDVSDLQINRSEDQTLTQLHSSELHDINLVCADVELHFAIMSRVGEDLFNGRYNIAIWAWEQPRFPRKWHDRFAYYDEIWVASSFIANALAPVSPLPVVRIPPVLTVDMPGCRETGRRRLGVEADEFVFLFIFDFHSHAERKNPLATVEAFKRAFKPTEPTRLVLKCVNADSKSADFLLLSKSARGHSVTIHSGYWPVQSMRDLMAACDAYVSLHRSEGTGLTITDAMAIGKPVIATGWSGNMDYMNVSNSFPVRYELVELSKNVGPYQAGQLWAEPSVEHAAELMRLIYDQREQANACGEMARRDMERNYSEHAIGALIKERLQGIAIRRRLSSFQSEMKQNYHRYLKLPVRIRQVIGNAAPAGSIVLVVSKGDEGLLELGDRQAWHFPQTKEGAYAGYYPTDSAAAIRHLEELREKGAQFLLFPRTAFWWLEHYEGFRQHLEKRYHTVVRQDDACLMFAL